MHILHLLNQIASTCANNISLHHNNTGVCFRVYWPVFSALIRGLPVLLINANIFVYLYLVVYV